MPQQSLPDVTRLDPETKPRRPTPCFSASLLSAWLLVLCGCSAEAQTKPQAHESGQDGENTSGVDRAVGGSDWPKFLGPLGTGVSTETGFAETWPEDGPPVLWHQRIGTGYGAPSIRGNRLVVHHRLGAEETIECLLAETGDSLWEYSYPSGFRDPYGYNDGPRATPLLTDSRCYTLGAEGMLVCLRLEDGEKVWSRNLGEDFDLPRWFFGVGTSPILEEGKLIVLVGGQPNSGVVAFDPDTGDTLWRAVGKETWDGAATGWAQNPTYHWRGDEQIVSYASPVAVTIHGKRHLLCFMRHGLVSLDLADGSERFKFWYRPRPYESVNAARPVVVEDKIFLSAAYRLGSVLLQVNPDGESYEVLWKDEDNLRAHWTTPIHVDGYLYGFSGRHERDGLLCCIELNTGRVMWSTDGFTDTQAEKQANLIRGNAAAGGKTKPFPFFGRGSLIRLEDKFVVLGERGTLSLVKIYPQRFDEIARTAFPQIGYPSWTAPVLSRKRLYLRNEEDLICLKLP